MHPPTLEESRGDAVQGAADACSADPRERLGEARELVRALDRTGQRVRRKLQDAVAIAAREVDAEASGKLAQLRREYERGIAKNQFDDLAGDLVADLHEAEDELFEMLSRRLNTLVDELRDELEEAGVELAVEARLPDLRSVQVRPPEPDKKGIDPRDLLVGPLLGVVGLLTMNPILIAGGASVVLIRGTQVFDRSRKERARKQLADISSDFQLQLSLCLHQATVAARSSVSDELDDAFESRHSDLVEEIRSLEGSVARRSPRRPYRDSRLRDRC